MQPIYAYNKKKSVIANPFVWYSLTWIFVLSVCELGWSDLYPKIESNLELFLIVTSLISLLLAFILKKKCVYIPLDNPEKYYKKIIKWTKILYILIIVECLYEGMVPLLSYIGGNADMGLYGDFNMPIVHVVVVNLSILLFYFSAYCHFSSNKSFTIFCKPLVCLFFSPLVYMNRSAMIYMLFGATLVYMMSAKQKLNKLLLLIPIAITIVYFFGVIGNMRVNDPSGTYIREVGGATDSFNESGIPHEFFWGYLYAATPVGNLQNAINKRNNIENAKGIGLYPLIVNQVIPKFIGKRLGEDEFDYSKFLVVDALNVGTTYFAPYITWGYGGMVIVYVFIMLYCIFMLITTPVNSILHVPLICVLCNMVFFSLFDNMIVYMGLFPQLMIIFLLRKRNKIMML